MTRDDELFAGSGGGGGDQRSPTRTPDTLLSQDYLEIILGIAEGPIYGLKQGVNTPLENFFIGDTPLANQNGQSNFPDFNLSLYKGHDDDPSIVYNLGGVSSNTQVNTRLAYANGVTRKSEASLRGHINRLEVRLLFNQLVRQSDDGTFETDAVFRIEYKTSSSANWTLYNGSDTTIHGKTTSGAVKDFLIDVPLIDNDDWDVRVTKVSQDTNDTSANGVVVEMTWESIQYVEFGVSKFQDVAVAHLYGKASNQFSSIPQFGGVYKGLLCHVPNNYNPDTKTYDESTPWNGGFKLAFTDNPAWITYELATNPRFGLARYYLQVTANRYQFYTAAKWCDEKVNLPGGGTQPRFTFNAYITDQQGGLELLNYIAGSFNSLVMDDGNGVITLLTDQPRQAKLIFTPENVVAGKFSYTATDTTTRYNYVTATFVNPDLNWNQDRRMATLDLSKEQAKYGVIPYDFQAVGCTNEPEAIRKANYTALTATTEYTTVTFNTARTGQLLELFDTIYVADPSSGWSTGGRIKSVNGNLIQLRDPIYFQTQSPCTLKVQTFDGIVEVQAAPPAAGSVYSLTIIGGSLPNNLPDRTVFTAEDQMNLGIAKPFKVLSVTEADEGVSDSFKVVALEVNVNKYGDADSGVISTPSQYVFKMPGQPTLPLALNLESGKFHTQIASDGTLIHRIYASWMRPLDAFTQYYQIDYKEAGASTFTTLSPIYAEDCYLAPVKDGVRYDIRLFAVTPLGQRSSDYIEVLDYLVTGKVSQLENVSGFEIQMTNDGYRLNWTPPTFPDNDDTEIRHGSTAGSAWDNSPQYTRRGKPPLVVPFQPAGVHKFFAKYHDTSGNESDEAAVQSFSVVPPATPVVQKSEGYQQTTLFWSNLATSQPLLDYVIYRFVGQATDASQLTEVYATQMGTSISITEDNEGVYTYGVLARDKGGNVGSMGIVSATILGAGIPNGAVLPPTGEEGKPFYRTTDGVLYFWSDAEMRWKTDSIRSGDTLPLVQESRSGDLFYLGGILYEFVNGAWAIKKVTAGEIAPDLALIKLGTVTPTTYVGPTFYNTATGQVLDWKDGAYTDQINAAKITGEIQAAQLAANSVTLTQIADNLQVIQNVASVPSAYMGAQVYNTTTGKLLTWKNGAYTSNTDTTELTGQIQSYLIADGSINNTKMAAGLQAVTIATAQPAGSYLGSDVVSYGGKVYRWTAQGYVKNIDTSDLAGQIQSAQLAAGSVTQSILANGLEAVGIAGGVPGTAYLGSNVVVWGGKIYRWDGARYTKNIDTTELEGQIQSYMLAAGSVSQTTLANGLEAVGIAGSAPTYTYLGSNVVLWAGKIYRWDGAKYNKNVDTSELDGQIQAAQLAAGSVTQTTLANGLEAVGIAPSQPAGVFFGANVVIWASKLYRWTAQGYVKNIDTTDLSGTIQAAQIAAGAITQTQLSDAIQAVGTPASFPTSYISGTNMILWAGEIYRWDGGKYSKAVAATDVSGQITTGQIATGAITVEKFNAGLTPVIQATSPPGSNYLGSTNVWWNGQTYNWDNGKYSRAVATIDLSGKISDAQIDAVSSLKLVGNIQGTQIQDGAITTAKLLANSVTAQILAAGSVTAKSLAVGDLENLIPNNQGYSTEGWGTGAPLLVSLVDNTWNSAWWRQFGSGSSAALTLKTRDAFYGPTIPVKGGDQFMASFLSVPEGGITSPYDFILGFAAWDATGQVIQWGACARRPAALSGSQKSEGWGRVIEGAAYIRPWLSVQGPVDDIYANSRGAHFTDLNLRRKNEGALLVDGSITANLVAANSISADALQVNSVVAGKLAVGAVTAGTIAAGAVTADTVAAGAISTEKLTVAAASGAELIVNGNFTDLRNGHSYEPIGWVLKHSGNTQPYGFDTEVGGSGEGTRVLTLARVDPSAAVCVVSKAVPITGGVPYIIKLTVNVAGGTARFILSDGTSVVEPPDGYNGYPDSQQWGSYLNHVQDLNQDGPHNFEFVVTFPTDRKWLSLGIHSWSGVWSSASFLRISNVSMKRQVISAEIRDGAILASKVAANAISADNIQAGAITVGKLAANSVTAGTIAAGAVNAQALTIGIGFMRQYQIIGVGNGTMDYTLGGFWWDGVKRYDLGPRGLNVLLIRRSDGAVLSAGTYDTYGSSSEMDRLAANMNAWGNDAFVFVASSDANQVANHPGLIAAMKRCGATTAIEKLNYRQPYVLAGIPGCGEGNGIESMHDNYTTPAELSLLQLDNQISGLGGGVSAFTTFGSTKIADGAIITAKIAAGNVTAELMAANSISANNLQAGSVVAGKLAADAVTAGTIAAGAITVRELAAGSVTAEKLSVVQQEPSLIFNPSFEDGMTGWSMTAYAYNNSPWAWVDGGSDGTKCMWIGRTDPGHRGCVVSRAVAVTPGAKYVLRFKYLVNGARANMLPYVFQHPNQGDANGFIPYPGAQYFDQLPGGGILPSSNGVWQTFEQVFTTRADIGWLSLAIHNWEDIWEGNTFLHLDEFSLRKQVTSATIADGAIVAAKVAANAIAADNIQAGAIVAGKLAAGAVTAGTVAADAITAGTIAAGAISVRELAAGAVTTDKLVSGSVTSDKILSGAVIADKVAANAIAAVNLQAGSVVAGKLSADAVTAGTIAAGAITAREIQAGSISTDKLLVSSFSTALNSDPNFMDPTAWTSNQYKGDFIQSDSPSGRGAVAATNSARGESNRFPLDAGKTYKFSCYYVSYSGANGVGYLRIHRGGAYNPEIAYYSAFEGVQPNNDGVWRKHEWIFQPEAGTNFGWIDYHCNWGGNAGAWQFADLRVEEQVGATLIQNGSITTDKLTVNAVAANNIQAGAIVAGKLAADAVTAGTIAAAAITTRELSVGAVTAEKLSVVSQGENLVFNGSFEEGVSELVGWKNKHVSSSNPNWGNPESNWARDGARFCNSYRNNQGDQGCLVSRAFPVEPGQTYKVSAWIRSNYGAVCAIFYAGYSTTKPTDGFNGYDNSNWWDGLPDAYQYPTPGGDWLLYERVFTVRSEARFMSVAIHNWGNVWDGPSEMYLDHVQIRRQITSAVIQDGAIVAEKVAANAIAAVNIQAGAIVAGKLAADAVTAGTIAAGAITAREVAAGAITTEKLAVTSQSENLILNGNFEDGLGRTAALGIPNWSAGASYNANYVSITDVSTNGQGTYEGRGCLRLARISEGDASQAVSRAIPVVPGDQYRIRFACRSLNGRAIGFHMAVGVAPVNAPNGFLDNSAAVAYGGQWFGVSGTIGNGSIFTSPSWAIYDAVLTIPNGMYWMSICPHSWSFPAPWQGDCYLDIDDVTIRRVIGTTLIADGAITTDKLIANAVTAGKVAANAIAADNIQAGAIVAGKLAAGVVTATELAAGSVTASKLTISDFENLVANGTGASTDGWSGNVSSDLDANGWASWWNAQGEAGSYSLTIRGRDTYYGADFPVKNGDEFYAKFLSVTTGGGVNQAPVSLGLMVMDGQKGILSWSPIARRVGIYGGYKAEGTLKIQNVAAAYARVWFQIDTDPGTASTSGYAMHTANHEIRRRNNGNLLVDGIITTNKMSANSVTSDQLVANAVTAGKLDASVITARELSANSVVAGKIDANAITAREIVAGAITARELSAGAVTADKINVINLAALNTNTGRLEIVNNTDGDWAWMRTYGKWLNDGQNGTVMARHSNGDAFFETKAGGCRIVTRAAGDYFEISWPQGNITASGLVINQANVIGELQLNGNAVTVPSVVPFGSNPNTQYFNFYVPGNGAYTCLVIFTARVGFNSGGGEGGETSNPSSASCGLRDQGSQVDGTGMATTSFATTVYSGDNTLSVYSPYGGGIVTMLVCKR